MPTFRYAQFCPLARATEILGERWTLLIVRELMLGPQRFSDLKRRLPGISTSVLSARLRSLEQREVVRRRLLPPPAASSVFELTPLGQDLRRPLVELSRWGLRFMEAPQPGDHYEPSWMRLGLFVFASARPSPPRLFEIRVPDAGEELVLHVRGGDEGTVVLDGASGVEPDATLRCEALALLALISGAADPIDALRRGEIEASGDLDALKDLPALFALDTLPAGRSA